MGRPFTHWSDICVLCGERPATTRDHLPPKGLLAEPFPPNLITVPACTQCNNQASKMDDEFQAYLAIHVGGKNPPGDLYFQQRGRKNITKNQKRARALSRGMKKIDLVTPAGLWLGKAPAVLWDSDAHDAVVERMIRGLYWHHTRRILPASVKVNAHWYPSIHKEMILPFLLYKGDHVGVRKFGGDQFSYGFMIDPGGSGHSVWLFQFHRAHSCGGTTRPPEGAPDVSDGPRQDVE